MDWIIVTSPRAWVPKAQGSPRDHPGIPWDPWDPMGNAPWDPMAPHPPWDPMALWAPILFNIVASEERS